MKRTTTSEHAGHQTYLAHDGEEALAMLESGEHPYHLAIIDMHMPQLSGPEVVQRWRFVEKGHLPIVMLTADASPEAKTVCEEAGADTYLTKPVNSRELVEVIARLADQHAAKTPATVAPATAQADELDESVLDELAQMGGQAFVEDLLTSFEEDSERALRDIVRALEAEDYGQWHDQLHMLKGGASDVGANTAAINPSDIAAPIRSILRGRANVDVVLGAVTTIVPAARQVQLTDGAVIGYDWLVLAPGGRHAYSGHPEWEVLAPGLKTVEDALEIRRRMLLAFERAERAESADERHRHLTFVVVGGGPTGVEVAGAIAEIKNRALTRDFRHIDPRDATVLLLEGGPRILPSYPPELSQKAKEILRGLGVDVRTDAMVAAIEPGVVQVVGWRIPTDTVVWAAGNAASPLLQDLGAPLDRLGRVVVEPDCTIASWLRSSRRNSLWYWQERFSREMEAAGQGPHAGRTRGVHQHRGPLVGGRP